MDIEVTKAQREKFIKTAEILRSIQPGEAIDPVLHRAQIEAAEAVIQDLDRAIAEYEASQNIH